MQGLNPLGGVGSTVTVQERPITTGGGINGPQGVNMQRQVYDRNYYVNKTKEKLMVNSTLTTEHSIINGKSSKENRKHQQRTTNLQQVGVQKR